MVGAARIIRILIADDHTIFREGLRRLLETEPDFQVVGEAADGAQGLELVATLHPDVLLLDLAMPRLPGLETLRELGSSHPVRTLLLTAAIDKRDIVEALQLGARGVVLKETASELLFKAIRAIMGGEYWVGRERVSDLVESLRQLMAPGGEKVEKKTFGLTPRELEVVSAVLTGQTNKEIAAKYSLSEQTVKHHLSNVFDKVGVSNRLELALFAIHHRLVSDL